MATRSNRAGDLPNVCDTLLRGGEEMKYSTVMPNVVGHRPQRDLGNVCDRKLLATRALRGAGPTERTEVRILYTKHEVYFGITCFDSDPSGIVATELRRDVSHELDDYVETIIDSSHDRRNAYVFQINPLGTQRDALITEEQAASDGDGDPGWDGVWTSEAHIAKQGWTATVGIPFSTLNFMQSSNVIWGINFKRFIRRKNEENLWSGWQGVYGAARIGQAGELHGISDIGSGRLFIVKPYGLGGFTHLPPSAAGKSSLTALPAPGSVTLRVVLRWVLKGLIGRLAWADSSELNRVFRLY
jgi:hypothetical protein